MSLAKILLFVLLVVRPAFAGGFVEERNVVAAGDNAPFLAVSLADSVYRPLGWYAWSQVGAPYAQAYGGPTLSLGWLQVGVALGLEQAPRTGRFGSFVWVGSSPWLLLGVYENGGSGPFKKAVGRYQRGPTHVGLWYDNYLGAGPYLEVPIPRTPFILWGTVCQNATQVAVKMTF